MKTTGIILILLVFQQIMNAQIEMPDFFDARPSAIVDTSYTYQWIEESETWEIYSRDLRFMDKDRLVVSVLKQRWYKDVGQWENYEQTLKNHDTQGNEIQSILQSWNRDAKDWLNVQLKTTTYDRRGNEAEILYQEWHRPTEEWFNTVVYLISYNRDFEKSEVTVRTYRGMENVWNNYLRFSFEYKRGYGHPDVVFVDTWNLPGNDWQTFGRYSLSYNNRGDITRETRATWSEAQNDWILGVRYLLSYARSMKTEDIEQRWDYSSKQWINALRKVFDYDEDGEIREEALYHWDKAYNQWELRQRFLYSDIKPEGLNS